MITTPETICDVFAFLGKDQIERVQLVSKFWNNVTIRHKNILPLRQFFLFDVNQISFSSSRIALYETEEDYDREKRKRVCNDDDFPDSIINFDGTNLSKNEENVSFRYSQLTVDEILTNLNDVVFDFILIYIEWWSHDRDIGLDNLLNLMKLVTTKIGEKIRGNFVECRAYRFDSKLDEIDNYFIVDELTLGSDSYNRELFANAEIVQLPSTPKVIRLISLQVNENEEILDVTCNGKLNGANRLTIGFYSPSANNRFENFILQWFELYRTHQNPISLVGKFELSSNFNNLDLVLDAVKTLLNNTQLRVKYSLETKELRLPPRFASFLEDEDSHSHRSFTDQYLIRRCILHETDSYALAIEMTYRDVTDMSSINASDLDQLPHNQMESISFCIKSL